MSPLVLISDFRKCDFRKYDCLITLQRSKFHFFLVKIHIIWWISVYNPCIYAFWNKMGQYRNSVHILLCTGLLKCWVDFIHIHCKELNATKMSMMWKKGVSVVFVALRIFGYKKLLLQWMRNMHIHLSKQEGWNENGSDFSITHIVQKFYDN